jgi:hypothetical protein
MDYISDLKRAIGKNHGCEAQLEQIEHVMETRLGGIIWEGNVAIFLLTGHPKARRCYAWGVPSGDEAQSREITTVLELPPVTSAESAVKAAAAAKASKDAGD